MPFFIFEMKTIYYLCVLKRNPSITGAKHCPRARKGIQQALRLAKLGTKAKRVNTLTFIWPESTTTNLMSS